jgi:uncharacterized protein
MALVAVRKTGGSETVAGRVRVADRFWSRALGLLGRRRLEPGEGLLLRPCRAVHTLGLGYPIDVAFLDIRGTVVAAYRALAPNRRTAWHAGAVWALELPTGTLERAGLKEGQRLSWTGGGVDA